MADTFWVRTEVEDPRSSESLPSVIGAPFATIPTDQFVQSGTLFSIYNRAGSSRILRILNIELRELCPRTLTGLQKIALQKVSAMAAGGGSAIAAIKMDSNDADMPAEVIVVTRPSYLAGDLSGAPFRSMLNRMANSPAVSGQAAASLAFNGGQFNRLNSPTLFDARFITDVQPIVLNEGEGIVLDPVGGGSEVQLYGVTVWVSVQGGPSYVYKASVSYCALAMIGVFNGAGSGVVLNIDRVEVQEIADNNGFPSYSFESVSHAHGGIPLVAEPLDTNAIPLSAGVEIQNGAAATQYGPAIFGTTLPPSTMDGQWRRTMLAPFGISPGLASSMMGQFKNPNSFFSRSPVVANELILREGRGIALRQATTSSPRVSYEITCLFTAEVVSAPSAESFPGAFLNWGLNV